MKKIMRLILVCFFALIIIAGCGANNPNSDTKLNTYGNTPGNLHNGGFVAKQGDWIYYSDFYLMKNRGLYKIKTDGTGEIKLNDDTASALNVFGDWIYYMKLNEDGNQSFYKVKTDGTERTQLIENLFVSGPVFAQEDWLYSIFYEDDGFKLYKVKSDGTEKIKLDGENSVSSINLVGDWIYYASSPLEEDEDIIYPHPGDLYRIKIDGTERTKLSVGDFYAINVVDDWIYFTIYEESGIYKMKTDGTEKTKIADEKDVDTINVTGGWVYYTSFAEGESGIFKMKTDGTEKTKLTDGMNVALNIAGEWIYYLNHSNNGIELYKMKTDGTGKIEVN